MKTDKIFDIEHHGNTLIVIPQGDSVRFQESQLIRGIDKLHELIDQPENVNLVVDLGSAPYLGSLMISAVMAMGVKARENGGRSALCTASNGMCDVIRITKLDTVMPYFDTREEALASLNT